MPIYNLFISHSCAYGDAYDKLIHLLNNKPNFHYKDYSVPKEDPIHTSGTDRELYEAIKRKIQPTNVVVSLAGMVFCFIWYRIIRSYKDLNSGKFKVIHEIEKELPFSPYEAEWDALGRGKDSKRYLPFTNIEIWVPVIFGILHVLSVLSVLYKDIALISTGKCV